MARKTPPLTTVQIKAARPAEKEYTLQDGGGLFLLVKPSGSKLWRFSYYRPSDKKRILLSFGSLDDVSLADARKRRSEYRALISAGTDPQGHEKKKREAEARRQGNTFENVAAAWYQVKISQNLAPNTIKDIWRSLDKYVFPFIGNTPIDTLTARRFVEVLTPIKERGNLETLKRVLQRVNEVMDYAANSGLIDANPAMNVRKAFPSPVKKHMPTIRPEQLPELMQALSVSATERQTRLLIEWQLLTVTRPAEASSTRWDEIDLDAQRWTHEDAQGSRYPTFRSGYGGAGGHETNQPPPRLCFPESERPTAANEQPDSKRSITTHGVRWRAGVSWITRHIQYSSERGRIRAGRNRGRTCPRRH